MKNVIVLHRTVKDGNLSIYLQLHHEDMTDCLYDLLNYPSASYTNFKFLNAIFPHLEFSHSNIFVRSFSVKYNDFKTFIDLEPIDVIGEFDIKNNPSFRSIINRVVLVISRIKEFIDSCEDIHETKIISF